MVAIFAHRGAHGRGSGGSPIVGNTLEAFCEARRLGVDGVELDVRRSADGALVVHHDPDIPGVGTVATLRVTELPSDVPLLDAAVLACGDLLLNIEMKDLPGEPGFDDGYPVAGLVAAFVADRDLAARVVVSSFDPAAIDALRLAEPTISTAWLTMEGADQRQALDFVVSAGHAALHPHHQAVTSDLVEAAHEAGVAVNTWTVDDLGRMRGLAAAGVDGIITNRPELAVHDLLTGR